MNIEEKDLGQAIEMAAPYRSMHANENDRGTPGSGHVPATVAAAWINYSGALVIESFTTEVKEIARARLSGGRWRTVRTRRQQAACSSSRR
jgi:D-psicose/D-tagatose/L-ribulose 3-epimerase